jgi:hypothetical protein
MLIDASPTCLSASPKKLIQVRVKQSNPNKRAVVVDKCAARSDSQ